MGFPGLDGGHMQYAGCKRRKKREAYSPRKSGWPPASCNMPKDGTFIRYGHRWHSKRDNEIQLWTTHRIHTKNKAFYGKVSRELEHRTQNKYIKSKDYSTAEYHSRQNISKNVSFITKLIWDIYVLETVHSPLNCLKITFNVAWEFFSFGIFQWKITN